MGETFSVPQYPEMFISQYPIEKCIDHPNQLPAISVMMTPFSFANSVFKGVATCKKKILSKANKINQPHWLNLDN